ncbi:hypothetical protein EVA_17416 [gut metagenome]|uniref:Uncharacterized protein n=1 Tax=gut metagenome TaxID=749906 RepID=J9FY52_9ZZZZ
MTCAQSWCICNTSATISTLCATSSGCGETRWISTWPI